MTAFALKFECVKLPLASSRFLTMQILIADDHTLMRAGLRQLIDSMGDFEVIGEASSSAEIMQNLQQNTPDLLLLDISLPDGNGLDLTPGIREHWPQVKIVVLSMHSDMDHVKKALVLGVNGFLVKASAPEELALALRTVHRGKTFLSPSISNVLVDAWNEPEPELPIRKLSPRQKEILDLIGQGFTTREIADQLTLSIKTIETHRSRMVHALGLKKGSELLRFALNHN